MLTTILLFPSIVALVTVLLNIVALHYESISAVPLGVAVKMVAIWLFVALPLAVMGTLVGRNWGAAGKNDTPCRVNSIPRPVPAAPW
jgi:hypothetical protein